ncbi:MAG: hypothetical protein AAF203_02690 [Pseudomonadota bacterium]
MKHLFIIIALLFFGSSAFASGGGTGPGAKRFLLRAQASGDLVAAKLVNLENADDMIVFKLKSGKKSESFRDNEEFLETELPKVLDALERSHENDNSFEKVEKTVEI